jgi:hypothetical protein
MIVRRQLDSSCSHRWEYWNTFFGRHLWRCSECFGFIWMTIKEKHEIDTQ